MLMPCLLIPSAIALTADDLITFISRPQHRHVALLWLIVTVSGVAALASVADLSLKQCIQTVLASDTFIKVQQICDAVYRLAQQLMHRAEDRLQRYLQRFLNNIILGNPTDSNLQEDDYHNLIYQVTHAVKPELAAAATARLQCRLTCQLGSLPLLCSLCCTVIADIVTVATHGHWYGTLHPQ